MFCIPLAMLFTMLLALVFVTVLAAGAVRLDSAAFGVLEDVLEDVLGMLVSDAALLALLVAAFAAFFAVPATAFQTLLSHACPLGSA